VRYSITRPSVVREFAGSTGVSGVCGVLGLTGLSVVYEVGQW
jgi:hypothetical protein